MKKPYDFVGKLKTFALISLVLILVCTVFNVIFGTEMDVTFKGGTLLRYSYEVEPDMDALTATAKTALGEDAAVSLDEVNSTKVVSITLAGEISMEQQEAFNKALEESFKDNKMAGFSANTLSASMGLKFFLRCLFAIGLAAVLLLVYVGIRFRKIGGVSAGVTALIALLHDLVFVYFTFVIFRIELNENFVAVVLTILGYSLNDTIVIFDRIRTNRHRMNAPLEEVVNVSLRQVMRRTIITAVAVCVAIATVAVVAMVMKVDSIISFALPMLIGSISGCYSSIVLSAPIWVRWVRHKEKRLAAKK